jgi:lipopolysaccharide export LptBFGC system permease protein LptF
VWLRTALLYEADPPEADRRRPSSRSTHQVADSLKLALAAAVFGTVARTDWLSHLPGASAETAAFILYFTWPALSIVMLCLTALFALRDFRRRTRVQAILALVVSVAVAGAAFTGFRGWE